MRKIISYIAMSLNGMIAQADGGVEWLEAIPNPDKEDFGYAEFNKTIDSTIQGYKTYAQVIGWGIEIPYKNTKNYIFSRSHKPKAPDVEFITKDHLQFVKKLKNSPGKNIWLLGGGQLNTFFLNHKLLDELIIFIMPVIIPNGILLFEKDPMEIGLILTDSKTYSNGVVELHYNLNYN